MAKKFWIFSLLILSMPIIVNAADYNITSPSVQQYLDNGTWTNFTYTIPYTATNYRLNVINSNIKNNQLIWNVGTTLSATGNFSSDDFNMNVIVRYGTTSSYEDITNYCNITNYKQYDYNDNIIIKTYFNIWVQCNYTGSNSAANWLQIMMVESPTIIPFTTFNRGYFNLDINTSDTNKIIGEINGQSNRTNNNIDYATQSIINNTNNSINAAKNNINSNINNSTADIIDHVSNKINEVKSELQVSPSGQFIIDSSIAESVEQKEGNLRQGLLDPYQDGNLNDYISSGSNTPEYANGLSFFWNIITNLIGPNSVLWILTSMILTLGIIKLVLSR